MLINVLKIKLRFWILALLALAVWLTTSKSLVESNPELLQSLFMPCCFLLALPIGSLPFLAFLVSEYHVCLAVLH